MLPNPSPIKANLPDIAGAWRAYKEKKIQVFPQNTLRASSIGHPCDRYHYHSIHDWKEKALHDAVTQSIFDEGNLHEDNAIAELKNMGFQIIEPQRSFQLDKPLITGHIDGMLRWEGQDFCFDVKSTSPYVFEKMNSAEDMLFSKRYYHRMYPGQLQIYLLMAGLEVGVFIFKNKLTGEFKPIWMQIDYDFAEQILKRAERVYAALKKESPPERINDFDICKECPFKQICLPDLKSGPGVQALDDMELAAMLDRREALAALAKEFESLDGYIKGVVKPMGEGERICGDFVLKTKQYSRTDKVPITYTEEKVPYYVTKIVKLNSKMPTLSED